MAPATRDPVREGFTDAMLQDIGLTRGGIEGAVGHGR